MSTAESTVDFTLGPLDRATPLFIAGRRGMVDTALHRTFAAAGFTELMTGDVDLHDRQATFDFFGSYRPSVVLLVADPHDAMSAQAGRLEDNVLAAAVHTGVPRLLALGTTVHQRIRDVRQRYGLAWICAQPTGVHGPAAPTGDVLSALIARYEYGQAGAEPVVTHPGSGGTRLELLHVDDLADACLHLLERFDGPELVNVGPGAAHTVGDIADVVATAIGYSGETRWGTDEPDGPQGAPADTSTLRASGWRPSLSMIQGIVATVAWYQSQRASLRQ
jgi:GDP-L-fucose synthase